MSYLYLASAVFVRPLRKGATVSKAVRSSLCVLREITCWYAYDRCACHIGRCYPYVPRPHIGSNNHRNGFDQGSAMERSHWVCLKVTGALWLAEKMVSRHVRTIKEPVQPVPLFEQLISLLMEVGRLTEYNHLWLMRWQPQNRHVSLNVGFS